MFFGYMKLIAGEAVARQVVETFVSDISGASGDDVHTVVFGLDDRRYEIDLTEAEDAKLREALEPYLAVARKAKSSASPARARASRSSGSGYSREELADARQWLKLRGHEVSDRGRIKAELLKEWEDAGRPSGN